MRSRDQYTHPLRSMLLLYPVKQTRGCLAILIVYGAPFTALYY